MQTVNMKAVPVVVETTEGQDFEIKLERILSPVGKLVFATNRFDNSDEGVRNVKIFDPVIRDIEPNYIAIRIRDVDKDEIISFQVIGTYEGKRGVNSKLRWDITVRGEGAAVKPLEFPTGDIRGNDVGIGAGVGSLTVRQPL